MNALAQSAPPVAQPATVPLLRTLVLCDLADSTALVGRLGDQRAAELFRRHDRAVRDLLQTHGGREIDKTDGFLAMFERPIQAVAFALDYQRQLRRLGEDERSPLVARVGIHVGDVLTWDNTPDDVAKGAKATEVEGLVKPIASRLMQLALPGQTLLSGVAYSLAHRAQGELGERLSTVRWRTHGRYQFKGIPDPIPVFEVGEEGLAPLKAPPWSGKAHREIPFWRRPATLTIELFLLAAVVAIPLWYLFKPAPAIAFANRDWVVVGDLKNLTGESKFDESLQTAFRIGLEQSRYVNVLSDLKTRETIKLMQRDPEKTAVDRNVGSEIAIRDGARALILPTVAEIGGRVRVTAEVVDPNTQTTVYSESADGVGEQSVLPSLDKVNQRLRVRLGEALETVSSESTPLDKAATKNLEALRAYTLARRAYATGNSKEALALLQQAVKLDSNFALARTLMASIYLNVGENTAALREIDAASAIRDRLSSRDALYVDAWKALFGPPAPALDKWKALSQLYPDFFTARGIYGFYAWQSANQYDEAIKAYASAASSKNPKSEEIEAILGVLTLGQEKYEEAGRHLATAANLGLNFAEFRAATEAAQRRFGKIEDILNSSRSAGVEGKDVTAQNARISFSVDQGRWPDAWAALAKNKADIESNSRGIRKLNAVEVSLKALFASEGEGTPDLQEFIKEEQAALSKEAHIDRSETTFHLIFASYLAANRGDEKLAQLTLSQIGAEAANDGYPVRSHLATTTRAEIERASGRPDEAIRILKTLPLDGSEMFVTRVALMDAYAAKGDFDSALEHARWLASHRGRAYTEYNSDWIMRPFNVAHSNLALLRAAEFSAKAKDERATRSSLDEFLRVWPEFSGSKFVAPRVQSLQSWLQSRPKA